MNLETTKPRGTPRSRWLDEVREDGRRVCGEEWQEKIYDREEWKRLLRTARNQRILYMLMDWFIDKILSPRWPSTYNLWTPTLRTDTTEPCHTGPPSPRLVSPQFSDAESLQLRRAAANILSQQQQTGKNVWSESLQVGQVASNSAWHKTNVSWNLILATIHSRIVTINIHMMLWTVTQGTRLWHSLGTNISNGEHTLGWLRAGIWGIYLSLADRK